jgi:hypothetical protein
MTDKLAFGERVFTPEELLNYLEGCLKNYVPEDGLGIYSNEYMPVGETFISDYHESDILYLSGRTLMHVNSKNEIVFYECDSESRITKTSLSVRDAVMLAFQVGKIFQQSLTESDKNG